MSGRSSAAGFAGKYNYVSPEQLGMTGGEVTFKSDIYSFGLVLAEAARGRALDMSGSQADIVEKRRSIPDFSDVDRSIRPLIHAMLEPLPNKRPASMAHVAEWGESPRLAAARRAQLQEEEAPAREGSGGRLAAIVGAVLVAVGVTGVGYVFRDDLATWIRPAAPPLGAPTGGQQPAAAAPKSETGSAALPPLAEPHRPATGTTALPPLVPATPSPPAPPPAKPAQNAAPPQTEAPAPAAPSRPPAPAPPAQHIPTSDELVAAEPPHAPQPLIELPPGAVGTPYRAELPGFADHTGKGLRLAVDALPPGLAFQDLGDGKGVIEGEPAQAGAVTARITATNPAGRTAQMMAKLVIAEKPALSPVQPAPSAKPDQEATPAAPAPAPPEQHVETPKPQAEQKAAPPAAPPQQEARLEAPTSAADRERLFVQGFDGGACFLVKPLAGGGRAYMGVGDQLGPFQQFEEAFKREFATEPQLSLRLITAAECPAIDLIRAGGQSAGAPRIELKDYRVGRNKPLAGTIGNLGGRHAYLILVDNDGAAYRLDAKSEPSGDAATFSVPLTPDAGSTGPLQVVLAIVSAAPIPALETFRSGSLNGLTPTLLQAAQAGSAAVGAEFFTFAN